MTWPALATTGARLLSLWFLAFALLTVMQTIGTMEHRLAARRRLQPAVLIATLLICSPGLAGPNVDFICGLGSPIAFSPDLCS